MDTSHYDRAVAFLKSGQYREAIEEFTSAIEIDPNSPNSYVGRALAHRSLGNEVDAASDEQMAQRLGGVETSTWSRLCNRAYQRMKTDPADGMQGKLSKRAEFYQQLDPLSRKAVLLGDFHLQVMNGGIQQWIANGYSAWIRDLMGVVAQIGTNPALAMLAVLRDVGAVIADMEKNPQVRELGGASSCLFAMLFHQMPNVSAKDAWLEEWLERIYSLNDRFFECEADFCVDANMWFDTQASHQ
jgi:hypothetical protein